MSLTHSPPKLDDTHVGGLAAPVHWHQRDPLDPLLDGICYVRHHLRRAREGEEARKEVAFAFLCYMGHHQRWPREGRGQG